MNHMKNMLTSLACRSVKIVKLLDAEVVVSAAVTRIILRLKINFIFVAG